MIVHSEKKVAARRFGVEVILDSAATASDSAEVNRPLWSRARESQET
jgi:hypothetical protein